MGVLREEAGEGKIEVLPDELSIPEGLRVMVFPRGDVSLFPQPPVSSAGTLGQSF